MCLNNITNNIEIFLPNNLKDALIAYAKEKGNTEEEEILFRLSDSLEKQNDMQVKHRFKWWLESRKAISKNNNISI